MKLFENKRVRVRIPDSDWRSFVKNANGDGIVARGHVLSEAMVKLANARAVEQLQREPEPTDEELEASALRALEIGHLAQNTRYNFGELCQRLYGGYMMSPGMMRDVTAARGYAVAELNGPNREHWLEQARERFALDREAEYRYRSQRGGWADWDVQVIGPMPEQIGLVDMTV